MSVVIRLKVPTEMHYTVIPMGTSKVNSSQIVLSFLHTLSFVFVILFICTINAIMFTVLRENYI